MFEVYRAYYQTVGGILLENTNIETGETRKHTCFESKRVFINNSLRSMKTKIWLRNADQIMEALDNLSNNCRCELLLYPSQVLTKIVFNKGIVKVDSRNSQS